MTNAAARKPLSWSPQNRQNAWIAHYFYVAAIAVLSDNMLGWENADLSLLQRDFRPLTLPPIHSLSRETRLLVARHALNRVQQWHGPAGKRAVIRDSIERRGNGDGPPSGPRNPTRCFGDLSPFSLAIRGLAQCVPRKA